MILREESFGNVLRTLDSPKLYGEQDKVDVPKILGVPKTGGYSPEWYDKLHYAVRLFVYRCMRFNRQAYVRRYDRAPGEPPITAEYLDAIENRGKVVSRAQLFMTLHCIVYNSDVRDYMDEAAYARYSKREEFELWIKQAEELAAAVAEAMAWRQAHNENCNWG